MEEGSFTNSTSQLVKSFWAGKIIQQLELTKERLSEEDTLQMSPNPPHREGKLSPLLLEQALGSVRICATSLSPRVRDVICGGSEMVDAAVPLGVTPVHSDGTLDWSSVASYFDASEIGGWL